MSRFELEDLPVDPREATDLALHVTNCVKRHTALVRLVRHDKIMTWLYRAGLLPLAVAAVARLYGLT